MAENAYVHIPFCKSKCRYCTFVSYCDFELKEQYIESLLSDIKTNYSGEKLKTIYIGGGTPSVLSVNELENILSCFNMAEGCEITIEINPDDTDFNYFKKLKSIGINRISIGAQTFDDNILNYIGRRHSSCAIVNAVNDAYNSGFENVSLDIIYGLPYQTLQILESDLKKCVNLGVKHISTYGLKIEEGSYFYVNYPESLPSDDIQADFYEFINDYLEEYNFNRYEISNFAINGYESMHNLNYWMNNTYYGFGVSAHGYIDGFRYNKSTDISDYIKKPKQLLNKKNINMQEKLEEEIFLGFRISEGINIKSINDKFNIDFEQKYSKVLLKYMPKYIDKKNDNYFLTIDGILLSNIILSDFIK